MTRKLILDLSAIFNSATETQCFFAKYKKIDGVRSYCAMHLADVKLSPTHSIAQRDALLSQKVRTNIVYNALLDKTEGQRLDEYFNEQKQYRTYRGSNAELSISFVLLICNDVLGLSFKDIGEILKRVAG